MEKTTTARIRFGRMAIAPLMIELIFSHAGPMSRFIPLLRPLTPSMTALPVRGCLTSFPRTAPLARLFGAQLRRTQACKVGKAIDEQSLCPQQQRARRRTDAANATRDEPQ